MELTGEVSRAGFDSVTAHLSLGRTVTLSPDVVRLVISYVAPMWMVDKTA
ncbi:MULTISPECIES: hypothetical protein [unclassified Mesorhizobium]|nr:MULTISPECIES: hypothetical protein [unclassified Mesorhizobium]